MSHLLLVFVGCDQNLGIIVVSALRRLSLPPLAHIYCRGARNRATLAAHAAYTLYHAADATARARYCRRRIHLLYGCTCLYAFKPHLCNARARAARRTAARALARAHSTLWHASRARWRARCAAWHGASARRLRALAVRARARHMAWPRIARACARRAAKPHKAWRTCK